MKTFLFITLIFMMFPNFAMAEGRRGAYVAADYGSAIYSNFSTSPKTGMLKIAGGYQFNTLLKTEIGFTKFGLSNFILQCDPEMPSIFSMHAVAFFNLPLAGNFEVLAKLGISNNNHEANNAGTIVKKTKNSAIFGLGVQYFINNKMVVRLQYEDYGEFENAVPAMSISAYSIGVAYNF